jgi:hypothetical protein
MLFKVSKKQCCLKRAKKTMLLKESKKQRCLKNKVKKSTKSA